MSQSCLNCLKYTMCAVNFLCWLCGTVVLGYGIFLMTNSKFSSLIPSIPSVNLASTLVIVGTIVTCVSFLGFLGALKENRCLLISFFTLLFILMMVELTAACLLLLYEKQIDTFIEDDLKKSLESSNELRKNGSKTYTENDWDKIQRAFQCCGVQDSKEWTNGIPQSCCNGTDTCSTSSQPWQQGCYNKLKLLFEENFLTTGAAVIVVCIIEVLAMCFSMTLFCHISRSGLGYK